MSIRTHVEELVSLVERGELLGAFQKFYAEDVEMQENSNPPTVGKAANLAREEAFVSSIAQVHEGRAESILVDQDKAAIHWILDFTDKGGQRHRTDQIAYQTWRGDQIVRERFFYDASASQGQ